jgi:hypothetical protein
MSAAETATPNQKLGQTEDHHTIGSNIASTDMSSSAAAGHPQQTEGSSAPPQSSIDESGAATGPDSTSTTGAAATTGNTGTTAAAVAAAATAAVAAGSHHIEDTAAGPTNHSSRRVTIGHNSNVAHIPVTDNSSMMSVGGGSTGTGPNSMMGGGGNSMTGMPPTTAGLTGSGSLGMMMDPRRGSMGSGFGNMDDFFGARRNSFGFDMGMENFFGRRDSMDSSTAALDMAIMDLSRRRYSAAMGANVPMHAPPTSDLGLPQGSMGSFGFPPPGMMAASSISAPSGSNDSIMQRQQQLQQQQRELEQRQRELEFQRQQLIANMQERSYGPLAGPAGGVGLPPMYHRNSLGGLGGSLGLGSVQSHGTGSLTSSHMQASSQVPPSRATNSAGSASSAGSQKWWICQVCQSKAFVSQDEALAHEAICQEVGHSLPMQFSHDMGMGLGMGRNFSMGFGMDTSQRGIGMGLTTMIDNSSRGVVSLGMDSSRGGSTMEFDRSRNTSLGMDSSNSNYTNYGAQTMSTGPVNTFIQPVPLAMPSDKDWLTPLHCFVRLHCVEVFTATKNDVATPSKGKRKAIQVGQVGIRCPHCSGTTSHKARERGSVYYPTSISSIYNATMNLLQRHLHSCPSVPDEIMRRYETLKADDARSGTSKRYWIESALSLGLVDTAQGIRHSALPAPPLPTLTRQQETTGQDMARRASNEYFGSSSNLVKRDSNDEGQTGNDGTDDEVHAGDSSSAHQAGSSDATCTIPLVYESDKPYSTDFSYQLMDQMQPCVFTEADRLGKRKGLPPGFPGLACRHCFGGYGSGRFFPSTIKTLSDTSKTLNVLHNHMMRCRKCPSDVKESLEKLRVSHDEERSKMKFGSQKAFFGRIWERLHAKPHGEVYMQLLQRHNKPSKRSMEQDQLLNGGYDMSGGDAFVGLEALAAASSPSKRSKV